jgi:hypothetical protein
MGYWNMKEFLTEKAIEGRKIYYAEYRKRKRQELLARQNRLWEKIYDEHHAETAEKKAN